MEIDTLQTDIKRESVFVQQPVLGLNRLLDPVCDKVSSCLPL